MHAQVKNKKGAKERNSIILVTVLHIIFANAVNNYEKRKLF